MEVPRGGEGGRVNEEGEGKSGARRRRRRWEASDCRRSVREVEGRALGVGRKVGSSR